MYCSGSNKSQQLEQCSLITSKMYFRYIKFRGLIFHAFDWQENSWGINFCSHGGVVGTIIVGFAKYHIEGNFGSGKLRRIAG